MFKRFRFVYSGLAITVAAAGYAQISNVSGDVVYNNVQEGWTPSYSFLLTQQQFLIQPFSSSLDLTAPPADVTVSNPLTPYKAELKTSSGSNTVVTSSSNHATLNANGFASSETITNDPVNTFWSNAASQSDLFLHLNSAANVTFSVDSSFHPVGYAGCQFGFDNAYVGDFLTAGSHTVTEMMGAGDHDIFMFFFSQAGPVVANSGPVDTTGYAGGNYSINVQAVPEPASMAALGIGGLAMLRRRRARR